MSSGPRRTGALRWLEKNGKRILQAEWVARGGAGDYYWIDVPVVSASAAKAESDKSTKAEGR